MAKVKTVVTSGKRGIGVNRKGRKDPRVIEMVYILIWMVVLHLYTFRKMYQAVQYCIVRYTTINKLTTNNQ